MSTNSVEKASNLVKNVSSKDVSVDENDIVPGTVHLIDILNVLEVKKKKGNDNIILIPPPSSNPNDPLRWSRLKKNLQFGFLWFWSFILALSSNWNGPYWTVLVEELNTGYMQLNISSAICFLFLGVGCVILQPTAMKLGRRFVYLMCSLLSVMGNAVGATTKNVQYLYAANALVGLSAAPVDSLVEISSTDVFFLHERASKLSMLIFALYAGCDIGPTISGYVGNNTNYKRGFWILALISGVMFIAQLFLMEDTTFYREESSTEKEVLKQIKSHETEIEAIKSGQIDPKHVQSTEQYVDDDDSSIDFSIPKRTYWQRMKIFELEYNDPRSWFTIFSRPFMMVMFPPIVWGGIVYGAQMMWLSLLATTQSQIFYTQYGFSTSSTGLTNLAPFVGSIIGMFYGGNFVDWLSIKLAERNNGIMEPEFRLWAMILPTLFNAGGLLAYGLAPENHAPWPIAVVLGQGFLGFAMSSTGPISLTYAIDSYPELASEGLVIMLFIRNMIGCGFTFAIQPWLDRNGLVVTTWLMFMLSVVINGSFIFMILFGKKFRKMTKKNYYKFCDPYYGEFFKKK